MTDELSSKMSESHYVPSSRRWNCATFLAFMIAPFTIGLIEAVNSHGVFRISNFAAYLVAGAAISLIFTLLPIVIGSIIASTLYHFYKISSFWVYLFGGPLVGVIYFSIFGASFSAPLILLSLIFGPPIAVFFWLIVWWPAIRTKLKTRYQNHFSK